MKYNLVVDFTNVRRMTEEPQGEYLEFDSVEEFIAYTEEQLNEVRAEFPEGEEIIQKLKAGEYETITDEAGYRDVFVKVKSMTPQPTYGNTEFD